MGRSVSIASGAFAVAYKDCSNFGYREEDEEGNKIENPEYDEGLGELDWECFIDDITEQVKTVFPSFTSCDTWLDREDHAILENSFAYFGMSEYMGFVSLWLVLKDDLERGYRYDQDRTGLAQRWADQVKDKFEKKFGDFTKMGTFSNGESVYRRVEK